jgi:hypothetical protein
MRCLYIFLLAFCFTFSAFCQEAITSGNISPNFLKIAYKKDSAYNKIIGRVTGKQVVNIKGLDPRRASDITKKIELLETLFNEKNIFFDGKGHNDENIQTEIFGKIPSIAPHYPLESAKTNLFGEDMFHWIDLYPVEYMTLMKLFKGEDNLYYENEN